MAKKIIDSNKYLKGKKERFDSIFRNMYVSFEIEGIKIPLDEARKIAEEVKLEVSSVRFQKHHV